MRKREKLKVEEKDMGIISEGGWKGAVSKSRGNERQRRRDMGK